MKYKLLINKFKLFLKIYKIKDKYKSRILMEINQIKIQKKLKMMRLWKNKYLRININTNTFLFFLIA